MRSAHENRTIALRPEQRDEEGDEDEAPHERGCPEQRESGEDGDPRKAPKQIQPVRVEGTKLAKRTPDELSRAEDAERDCGEQNRQRHPRRRTGRLDEREVDDAVAALVDLDGHERDESEHRGQYRWRQP